MPPQTVDLRFIKYDQGKVARCSSTFQSTC